MKEALITLAISAVIAGCWRFLFPKYVKRFWSKKRVHWGRLNVREFSGFMNTYGYFLFLLYGCVGIIWNLDPQSLIGLILKLGLTGVAIEATIYQGVLDLEKLIMHKSR